MRYDTAVVFVRDGEKVYDPETGNYTVGEGTQETVYAAVSGTSDAVQQIVYGGLKQGSLTLHFQNHYDQPFDYLLVNGRKYRLDRERPLRVKTGMVVSEVL